MSRTVAALYDTRAEAETARARLSAEVKADQMRIIAKDTVAALDTLGMSQADVARYREALQSGGHLLVAQVASGQDAAPIVTLLEQSMSVDPGSRNYAGQRASTRGNIVAEDRIPRIEEELRIDKRVVERGGARVRSFTREREAEEQVTLRDEHVEVESRPADRVLTLDEAQAAGLLKDRVIEVSEMREEPVVTKSAVVREEIILKKNVTERVETIRDTVRHTEVEVEELPGERSALGLSRDKEERRT